MTKWTEHVKEYAKKNNISYGCAMSDPKMKEAYYKKHPKLSNEDKKQKKKEDDEKALLRTLRLSTKNFRDKFVKSHLNKPNDPELKNDMINKYRKFSPRLKDYIKQNAPNIYKLVDEPATMKTKKVEEKKKEGNNSERINKDFIKLVKDFNKNPNMDKLKKINDMVKKSKKDDLFSVLPKSTYTKFLTKEKSI